MAEIQEESRRAASAIPHHHAHDHVHDHAHDHAHDRTHERPHYHPHHSHHHSSSSGTSFGERQAPGIAPPIHRGDGATVDQVLNLQEITTAIQRFKTGNAVIMKLTGVEYKVSDCKPNPNQNVWDYYLQDTDGNDYKHNPVRETAIKKKPKATTNP
ncbi:MAG: hypothetical protein GOMPHAMPRED_003032 [Gomphillus americanus]|uniref:Uncharacterized protein n=1 Tax=Gomphillus americanus TaxID=1940652 RepID=A0A8H3EGZ1_9LECA|nr:MAG: hypothetical protein GOMPHAMPRED_003032 [Gomphillus americanus]